MITCPLFPAHVFFVRVTADVVAIVVTLMECQIYPRFTLTQLEPQYSIFSDDLKQLHLCEHQI
jgi:hypothetical protein